MTEQRDTGLTHLREDGSAHMVDVSGKDVTVRSATATGRVLLSPKAGVCEPKRGVYARTVGMRRGAIGQERAGSFKIQTS